MGPFDAALLASALIITTPILLAALGEVISERAGVLNVGLEGMVLAGAFFGFIGAWQLDSRVAGVVAGVAAGIAFAAIMALLTVDAKTDQIVAGVGLNILAAGITTFGFDEIFGGRSQVTLGSAGPLEMPVLSDLGGIGRALFAQDPVVYLAFLLVPGVAFLFTRTRWGLALRSAGEKPAAADTAGISVRRVRWLATLAAGGLAGLGGAYLSVIQLGIFRQEMSAGRGFLALTAVIFGRWRPGGVMLACLLFGGADALQLRLQTASSVPTEVWIVIALIGAAIAAQALLRSRGRRIPVTTLATAGGFLVAGVVLYAASPSFSLPSQLWLALPPLLALVALAVSGSSARVPAALTIPFYRGER